MADDIDIRRVARAVSAIENSDAGALDLLRSAYSQASEGKIVGVAGPPGAGKSTLVDRLAVHWAQSGEKVAVIAVDPASPYTGGAVLGDRIRMARASEHPGIYLRSLSSRGAVGGLSRAATDVVIAMRALGFDRVLVETVGSGQNDVDVADLADCVVVVSVPGLGDQIQASKAGILEIGDVYAVNKADLPGANGVAADLAANLDLLYPGKPGVNQASSAHAPCVGNAETAGRHGTVANGFWRPPILTVCARDASGIPELTTAIDHFLEWQRDTGRHAARLTERIGAHLLHLAGQHIAEFCKRAASCAGGLEGLTSTVLSGRATPDEAALELLRAARQMEADMVHNAISTAP